MITTVQGQQLYISELAPPFEKLAFQFVPDKIGWNRQGNFASVQPAGRNNPNLHYTGGTDKLSMNLVFVADDSEMQNVLTKVNWLRSLINNDSYNAPVKKLLIVYGNMFRATDKWVLESLNTEFRNFHSLYNYAPMVAECSLSLALCPDTNYQLTDIR